MGLACKNGTSVDKGFVTLVLSLAPLKLRIQIRFYAGDETKLKGLTLNFTKFWEVKS